VKLLLLLLSLPWTRAESQSPTRLAAGRVVRPSESKGAEPLPVAGQWVVLHRVGSDRAAPVDSALSGADGRFRIAYTPTGAADALYFVSSRFNGIAYFSPPLRADTVRGGDADVIVYATTQDTASLRMQGRHLVISMPRAKKRSVAEIFELENEGTHTIVPRDSLTPLWAIHVPAEAESLAVAGGDIGAGAVAFRRGQAELFAPISPGVRQLVLTYLLRDDAFPLSRPMERQAAVIEVLLEEPRAAVEGARLSEVSPASIEGRRFRRFLGSDVPASAVVRVIAPPPIGENRTGVAILAALVAAVMAIAAIFWRARRQRIAAPVNAPVSRVDRLVAEIAALDARRDRMSSSDLATRAQFDAERATLKAELARALAEDQQLA